MKKLILVISFLIILSSQIIIAGDTTNVFVSPSITRVNVNDNFTINIDINTTDEVYGFQFDLYFDPDVSGALSVSEGDFLKKDGASTFFITPTIDNNLGRITSTASTRIGVQTGVSGQGTLASMYFNAKSIGSSNLGLVDVVLSDPNIQSIVVSIVNGTVNVNRPPTVQSVFITPSSPYTNDTLICNFNITDPDTEDVLKANVTWFRNGVAWTNDDENEIATTSGVIMQTSSIGNVEQTDTTKGDEWVCKVTGYDGVGADVRNSSAVTIQNSIPVIDSFTPLSSILETREDNETRPGYNPLYNTLRFNHTSHDLDNDDLTYSWRVDGIERATTQSWLYSPSVSEIGNHNITLIVSDGSSFVSQSWDVTVKLRGDVKEDCKVNIFDLSQIGICYGLVPTGSCSFADIFTPPKNDGTPEGDGLINIFDLATVGVNFGRKC